MVIIAIEQAFKTEIFNLSVKDVSKSSDNEIDINNLIEKEKQKLRRIKEAFEDGVYTLSEYKESKQIIETQISNLESRQIKPQNSEKELRRKLIEKNKNVIQQLRSPNLSEYEKNDILRSFVDKIVFNRTTSSIDIFFYI